MNFIQRRSKRLCWISHKEKGGVDTECVFQISAHWACRRGIGTLAGFSTPVPKTKNVYSAVINDRNCAHTERLWNRRPYFKCVGFEEKEREILLSSVCCIMAINTRNNSQFQHQYKWSCEDELLLPLSNSYSTRANLSQHVAGTTAFYCYTWCCSSCHTVISEAVTQRHTKLPATRICTKIVLFVAGPQNTHLKYSRLFYISTVFM